MKKQILVLSDLHVGSAFGLLPPNFLDTMGNLHAQNVGQEYLWEKFITTLDRVSSRPIDVIVINGDTLDGTKLIPKTKGIPLTLHRAEDQREAAVKVLEEVRNRFPKAIWKFTEGTGAHEEVAEVKSVAHLLLGSPQEVKRTHSLRIGAALIRFHHEISFSSGFIKASGMEREFLRAEVATAKHGWETPDAEIRSHCHGFVYVGGKKVVGIVTPCWQLATDFITRKSPSSPTDIGAIVLTVDDSLKKYGACPVGFSEYLYDHPQGEIDTLFLEEQGEQAEPELVTVVA